MWFKIDDGFYDHPKVMELTLEAVGLWTLAGAYCARHLTDGLITARTAQRLGGTTENVTELVDAGLWEPTLVDGKAHFLFHDWGQFQLSREDVLADREAGRVRAAESRKRRKERDQQPAITEASPAESPAGSPERSPERDAHVREDVHMNTTATFDPGSVPPTRPDPTRPDHHEEPPAAAQRIDVDALFVEAWASWPKKVDKKRARQKFGVALRKSFRGREADLVKAVQVHGEAHRTFTEVQFVRGLAVWLENEGWDNPLPGTPEAGTPGTGGPKAPTKSPDDWMQPARPRRDTPRHAGEAA